MSISTLHKGDDDDDDDDDNNNNNNNNKAEIIIRDNKRRNIRVNGNLRQKYDQERRRRDFKIQRSYNRNTPHVECESKSNTGNNRGDWNHIKITQTVPEQHTGKARN